MVNVSVRLRGIRLLVVCVWEVKIRAAGRLGRAVKK